MKRAQIAMSKEANAVEQAVVRALRDSLERLQRNSDELHHAVADVVSACSSNKPTNALSPLLRANQRRVADRGSRSPLPIYSRCFATRRAVAVGSGDVAAGFGRRRGGSSRPLPSPCGR